MSLFLRTTPIVTIISRSQYSAKSRQEVSWGVAPRRDVGATSSAIFGGAFADVFSPQSRLTRKRRMPGLHKVFVPMEHAVRVIRDSRSPISTRSSPPSRLRSDACSRGSLTPPKPPLDHPIPPPSRRNNVDRQSRHENRITIMTRYVVLSASLLRMAEPRALHGSLLSSFMPMRLRLCPALGL